jgi:hypothetical protein
MPASRSDACRFSILLPTHNRAEVLAYAIRSLLWQTEQDFEVLVVGDGCTDNTADVVRHFRDKRIRWFDLPKAPNFGYASRNIALRTARGDLIAFMAHDDIVFPDHLERLGACLNANGAELVYSRPLWIMRDGVILPSSYNLHDPKTLASFLAREPHSIPALCVVHRRECFAKYGFWDESLPSAGDRDMWARIIAGGGQCNFAYEPVPTGLHFQASWKPAHHIGARELRFWIELHKQPGALPPIMKVPVAEGMLEQAAVWNAMAPDPAAWTRHLRAGIQQALDQSLHALLLKTLAAAKINPPAPDAAHTRKLDPGKVAT